MKSIALTLAVLFSTISLGYAEDQNQAANPETENVSDVAAPAEGEQNADELNKLPEEPAK